MCCFLHNLFRGIVCATISGYNSHPSMRSLCALCTVSLFCFLIVMKASASIGEVYSETTYVPQFGLLTETQVRAKFFQHEQNVLYVGATLQRQDKIKSDDQVLYSKNNRTMGVLGGRTALWKSLAVFAEYRTEKRSRFGLYFGEIFEYQFKEAPLFSEVYVESVALPSFDNSPVTTAWFKQGLRYHLSEKMIIDPYAELYLRRSPKADLGRDTEQARLGVRGIYLFGTWSAQLLVYQSFEKHERDHEEALFVFGGEF